MESHPKVDPLVLRAITRGRLRSTPRVALAICSHDCKDGYVEVCATNVWGAPYLHGIFTTGRDVTPEQCRTQCEEYIMRRARQEAELVALNSGPFPALAVGDEFMVGDEILWVSTKSKAGKLTIEPIATRWYTDGQVYDILNGCNVWDAGSHYDWKPLEGETKQGVDEWQTLYTRSFVERLVRDPSSRSQRKVRGQ